MAFIWLLRASEVRGKLTALAFCRIILRGTLSRRRDAVLADAS
jgi:hypothetical protein